MKKFFPRILISVVAIGIALSPFGAHLANAESWIEGKFTEFLAKLGDTALQLCAKLLWLAGSLFDSSVNLSINNAGLEGIGVVQSGWEIARNLANITFIFILIYIGIATILQLSGHGMRDLLVKVIIIALLVNFSLIISQTVIGASNMLAREFHHSIGAGEELSAMFVSGLSPQTIYQIEQTSFGKSGDRDTTAMQIIMISVFGCAIVLVAAFVLLVGAVLFLLRSVTLSVLMILAPLAFVAMALPNTRRMATDWWIRLFKQAFFAPAFLFMFYLTAKTIVSQGLSNFLATQNSEGFAGILFDQNNVGLAVQYIILIILMLATLSVAKIMGAHGADGMISLGNRIRKGAQGYAGRMSQQTGRRLGGGIASKTAPALGAVTGALGKTQFGKAVSRVLPLKTGIRAQENLIAANKARINELKSGYENYSPKQLKNMLGTTGGFNRAAILQRLADIGDLKGVSQGQIDSGQKVMERYGMKTDTIKELFHQYAQGADRATAISGGTSGAGITIKPISHDSVPKLDGSYFSDQTTMNAMNKSFGENHMKEMMSRSDAERKAFFDNLMKDAGTTKTGQLETWLDANNKRLASWARGPAGQNVLKAHGFTT